VVSKRKRRTEFGIKFCAKGVSDSQQLPNPVGFLNNHDMLHVKSKTSVTSAAFAPIYPLVNI